MPSEAQLEIYKQSRAAQEKYVYFMLAASGACIAFAVTKTQDAALGWRHIAVGLAVISWATSFYAGVMHLRYVGATLAANHELLKVEAGQHREVGRHPGMIAAASEGIHEAISSNEIWSVRWARAQTSLLVAGAAFYLAWHVTEMFLRNRV